MREIDEKIEKAIQSAYANVRLEGLKLSDDEVEMVRKYMHGEITYEEYFAWMLSNVTNRH